MRHGRHVGDVSSRRCQGPVSAARAAGSGRGDLVAQARAAGAPGGGVPAPRTRRGDRGLDAEAAAVLSLLKRRLGEARRGDRLETQLRRSLRAVRKVS